MNKRFAFLDAALPDLDILVAEVSKHAQTVILEPNANGLMQIADALEGLSGLATIDIFSHGTSGSIQLGGEWLDAARLLEHESELGRIGASLRDGGDILLYGCNLGSGPAGLAFIDSFADLTARDVAASDDLTGAPSLGGDWDLEQRTGAIDTRHLAVAGFNHTLAQFTGTTGDDVIDGTDAADTLDGRHGNDQLSGRGGDDTLLDSDFNSGNDQFTGGTGADTFRFDRRRFGEDRILDFTRGEDLIDLSRLGIGEFATLLPFIHDTSLGATIELRYETIPERILIQGVDKSDLTANDFILAASASSNDQGSAGEDWLFGSGSGSTLNGGRGNDRLFGEGGDDILVDGSESTLYPSGDDEFAGGAGADVFRYDRRAFGQDKILDFTQGVDVIDLSRLGIGSFNTLAPFIHDTTAGATIELRYNGTPERLLIKDVSKADLTANDFVFGTYTSAVDGGSVGEDWLFGGSAGSTLNGGRGNDRLFGEGGDDTLIDSSESSLHPSGNDEFTGGIGADTFRFERRAFGHDKILDFTPGEDRIDVASLGIAQFTTLAPFIHDTSLGATIELRYNGTLDSILIKDVRKADLTASDFVFGTSASVKDGGSIGDDWLFGGSGDSTLNGGRGNDRLFGEGGADTLIDSSESSLYPSGDDEFTGGAGADIFRFERRIFGQDKILDFSPGEDRIDVSGLGIGEFETLAPLIHDSSAGATISLRYNGKVEGLLVTGVPKAGLRARDFIFASAASSLDAGSSAEDWLFGGNTGSTLNGGRGNDRLFGGGGQDTLLGGEGNDYLDGGTGKDSMSGGMGNDTYLIDRWTDEALESSNQGWDTVEASSNYKLGDNIENLALTMTASYGAGNTLDNRITGNDLDNILRGEAGNDTLDGGAGKDTLYGGAGNDTYFVDRWGERVVEYLSQGWDTVRTSSNYTLGDNVEKLVLTGNATYGAGNALNNRIEGNWRNDTLRGQSGNDTLVGNNGNDTLIGGAGRDTLNGGNGSDRFKFERTSDGGDTISGFQSGRDKIQVVSRNFASLRTGNLSWANFKSAGTRLTSGEAVFLYDSRSGRLTFDSNGNRAGGTTLIATLSGSKTLRASDIQVVSS